MIEVYDEKDREFGMGSSSSDNYEAQVRKMIEDEQKSLVMKPEAGDRKLATDDGKAQVYVSTTTVAMSNESNVIIVNEKGIIISGRTHITKNPGSIRINGFWVLNEELLTTLPSTTYTPIPVLLYKEIPFAKTASAMTKILKA